MTRGVKASEYVASLPHHWADNSLYGALGAVGRFNLCSAWDAGRLIDRWAAAAFEHSPPPKIANLVAFTEWASHAVDCGGSLESPLLHLVLQRAREDARRVPPAWLLPSLRWCRQCARSSIHLITHQHRANWLCPVHGARLEEFCESCGAGLGYRLAKNTQAFHCGCCGSHVGGQNYGIFDVGCGAEEIAPRGRSEVGRSASDLSARYEPEHVGSYEMSQTRVRVAAESVFIPGLPAPSGLQASSPLIMGLIGDLKVLYAETRHNSKPRSESSRILSRYFRFLQPSILATRSQSRSDVRQPHMHRLLGQVGVLALISGHRCVLEDSSEFGFTMSECPCARGFALWRRCTTHGERSGYFGSSRMRSSTMMSHLGLCLSLTWYLSVQSGLSADRSEAMAYYGILESWMEGISGQVRPVDAHVTGILDHNFQWFAIRCSHSSARTRERLAKFDAAKRPEEAGRSDILADIAWLMST